MLDCDSLRAAIRGSGRLIVYLHDNPDPDAIAAGWLLQRIAEAQGVRAVVVFGARLGRAENRVMVRRLKIPLRSLERRLRMFTSDRYALVDTQPGTGNNSFAHKRFPCHICVDHHPRRTGWRADFTDVRETHGCTTTLMLGYHEAFGLKLDPDLATAVAYAIVSETQDLEREASRADREAYQRVFPLVRLDVLGQIRHPIRTRAYYQTIARAMRQVVISRRTCICHIGALAEAEVVAEVADFLASMQSVRWCLVTGFHGGQLVVSLRSTSTEDRAERVIRAILTGEGKGGGHGRIAGGLIPCADQADYPAHALRITDRFLAKLRHRPDERFRMLLHDAGPEEQPLCIPHAALALKRRTKWRK